LGYAQGRTIAVNPVNPLPHKTRFHELAHILLGYTAEGEQHDGELTPRNLLNVKRSPSPCCVVQRWNSPASSFRGVTFKAGGVAAIQSRRSQHSAS
jgi:hypothetical protein